MVEVARDNSPQKAFPSGLRIGTVAGGIEIGDVAHQQYAESVRPVQKTRVFYLDVDPEKVKSEDAGTAKVFLDRLI